MSRVCLAALERLGFNFVPLNSILTAIGDQIRRQLHKHLLAKPGHKDTEQDGKEHTEPVVFVGICCWRGQHASSQKWRGYGKNIVLFYKGNKSNSTKPDKQVIRSNVLSSCTSRPAISRDITKLTIYYEGKKVAGPIVKTTRNPPSKANGAV